MLPEAHTLKKVSNGKFKTTTDFSISLNDCQNFNTPSMNEDMMEQFADMIRNHVEQTWVVTEEISGNGNLFTRAVCKIAPVEVISCQSGEFELPMN